VLDGEEHANRSITIHLEQREGGNLDEKIMLDAFDEKREALTTEIIARAQMVLKAMKAQSNYYPKVTNRMAGVATLILRVARHEGWEAEARELLSNWHDEQMESAVEDDDFLGYMIRVMAKPEWKGGRAYSADELVAEFKRLGIEQLPWKNARALGVSLAKSKAAYGRKIGMTITFDGHTKSRRFTFNPSEAFLAGIRVDQTPVMSLDKPPATPDKEPPDPTTPGPPSPSASPEPKAEPVVAAAAPAPPVAAEDSNGHKPSKDQVATYRARLSKFACTWPNVGVGYKQLSAYARLMMPHLGGNLEAMMICDWESFLTLLDQRSAGGANLSAEIDQIVGTKGEVAGA
jgi:hypothetical protein